MTTPWMCFETWLATYNVVLMWIDMAFGGALELESIVGIADSQIEKGIPKLNNFKVR
jgi:hypothetical protein